MSSKLADMMRSDWKCDMTIAIDASRAVLGKRTGIEEYAYQTIKALRNELANERVILYVRKQKYTDVFFDFDLPKKWEVRELWFPKLWTQGRLAFEMFLHPPDTLFVPAHVVPWIHPKRTIVVVHGLEYEFCPEAYSWWERVYMRLSIRLSCRLASHIVAVSESTKRDLVRLYRVLEEKIVVVYEGVQKEIYRENEIYEERESSSTKLALSGKNFGKYFLFVGRIETRKNIVRMLQAFDVFKNCYKTDHQLVLVGKPGYGYVEIKNEQLKMNNIEDVFELGYVSDEEKRKLLKHADGFVFPSLYEGFGLPILEAQSVGIPVLTSQCSSMVEVSGENGAIFVDPYDTTSIAEAMAKLALDERLRSAIIESGKRNATLFSWEKCGKDVAVLLRD